MWKSVGAIIFGLLLCLTVRASEYYPATVAVYFSPNGGAQAALVDAIDKAKQSIYVQAYLFSNKAITKALVKAHQRGVAVKVIVDKKMRKLKKNTVDSLLKAGVDTFFDDVHHTAHNKVMIIDENLTVSGSFNFVKVAETDNAENLLLIRSPSIAKEFLDNWKKHLDHADVATLSQLPAGAK